MLDRRQLLKFAGIGAGALAVPGIAVAARSALPQAAAATTDVPVGAVPASKQFDLTGPSEPLLREVKLHETRVLQSFAFDNTRKHTFFVQLVDGGRTLTGETRAYTGTERQANGDLCLTRLDTDSGLYLGSMYLRGFGHGVQIGVETTASGSYVWTETKAVQSADSAGVVTGWGSRIARFKFANGTVLTPESPELTSYALESGTDRTTVALDPSYQRLTVRLRVGGVFKFRLFDLAAFKSGNRTPLAEVTQPADLQPGFTDTFQGFTTFGSQLYLLAGTAYGQSGSVAPDGNAFITRIDWNTGAVTQQKLTKAGYSLLYREPEGMAVQIPDPASPLAARLCAGFASFTSETDERKTASVYYKQLLV
nr:Tat pathway signal sequence domain protein [Streptomyces sp. NBC_00995]